MTKNVAKQKRIFTFGDYRVLAFLNALIVVYMSFGTVASQKVTNILSITFPVVSIWFSLLTFPVTDIICNEYGPKYARHAVFMGWLSMFVTAVIAFFSAVIPPDSSFLQHERTYDFMMYNGSRFLIVVTFSYLISQLLDIRIFHYLQRRTGGNHLWLRNNASTMISQTVNTLIFVFGMFIGNVSVKAMSNIFISTIMLKLILAILDTPLVYVGVYLVRIFRDSGTREGQSP